MTLAQILWLGLMGLIFALWALQMFRTLFALARRARRDSGQLFPGPISALRTFGAFLREPTFRPVRIRLLVLTAALLATSTAAPLVIGP